MIRSATVGLCSAVLLATAALDAQEGRGLSLHPVQALRSGEVTATGRAVAQSTASVGSRLAAAIVSWGKNEKGQTLDVGMSVKAGQALFSIDQSTFKTRLESARASLASAQAALDNLVAPMRKERLEVLRAAVAELSAQVKDRERNEARFRQLAEVDRTVPIKRFEEAQLDLELQRNQLRAAQARLDEALAGPTRTEIAMAESRVKEMQAMVAAAELDLRDTVILAPFDGVITRRSKGLGDYIAGAPFVEVLELTTVDQLEADLRLPESYLQQVTAGSTRLSLHSPLMKCALDLVVSRVVPDIDTQRGTFRIRVSIPAQERCGLVPGAFVTAVLNFDGANAGVVAPQQAILSEGGKFYVLVARDGKMRRQAVELGDRLTEGVVVKSGLQAGDNVVVGPAGELKDGAQLPDYLRQGKEKP